MIFIGKISKGHNSVKNVGGVLVLFFFLCTLSDGWFIFVQSFMKIFLMVLKLYSGHDFHRTISKWHNSVKNVGGVSVLFFSAHYLMVVYINKVS